jgi:hypothetical protein
MANLGRDIAFLAPKVVLILNQSAGGKNVINAHIYVKAVMQINSYWRD